MKKQSSIISLVAVLFVICAVVASLLALVNSITVDKIAEINAQKTSDAMEAVLPADSYDEISYTGADARITALHAAGDEGYVVSVTIVGSQGDISMVVGVDNSLAVTGVSIVSMSETPGLGDKASEPSFTDQFIGKSGSIAVSKDGGEIEALTGATVTSRAVANAVTAALDAAATVA